MTKFDWKYEGGVTSSALFAEFSFFYYCGDDDDHFPPPQFLYLAQLWKATGLLQTTTKTTSINWVLLGLFAFMEEIEALKTNREWMQQDEVQV